MQPIQVDSVFHIPARFSGGCPASVKPIEQLSDLLLGLDGILELTTDELKLVPKIRQSPTFDDNFQGCKVLGRSSVGRADAEDMGDKIGIP